MKLLFTLAFLMTLIPVALAGLRFEVHSDHEHSHEHEHEHEEVSVSEHSGKSESKESDSHSECPHFHVHGSSLCFGVLLAGPYDLNPTSYSSAASDFKFEKLSPQDYSNSLYRPPIA